MEENTTQQAIDTQANIAQAPVSTPVVAKNNN